MRLLELFSGTGVLSARFREGGWETREVDILKGEDVLTWEPDASYNAVWASVPCEPYSGLRYRYDHIWKADRTLWLRTLELIVKIRPRYWVIENVKMAQWVWGRAPYHYGPFFLWGYYPPIRLPNAWGRSFKGTHLDRATGRRWNEPRTAAQRAALPPELCDSTFKAFDTALNTPSP